MSGLVGFYKENQQWSESLILQMSQLISHRGEEERHITEANVALSERRVDVEAHKIDQAKVEAEFNHRYFIAFDGYLTGKKEIVRLLSDVNQELIQSDHYLVLKAFDEFGNQTWSILDGAFALVIYDKESQTLVGARDSFGIKPLYYTEEGMMDTFIFGSEIKAFLAHPDFKKELDKTVLQKYLQVQYNPETNTFFKGVHELRPGAYFVMDRQGFRTEKYHALTYDVDSNQSYGEAVEKLDELLDESIQEITENLKSYGSYLSGGIDSSLIFSKAPNPTNTLSVGFPQDNFDETTYAKELSEMLGYENESFMIEPDDFFADQETLQYHNDEPHANLSGMALFQLAKLARAKGERVNLSGEGADEFFAGYEAYQQPKMAQFYTNHVPVSLRRSIKKVANSRDYFKGQGFLNTYGDSLENVYVGHSHVMSPEEARDILQPPYRTHYSIYDTTKPYMIVGKRQGYDPVHRQTFLDLNVWGPQDIFLKADKPSMAHGQEIRMPLLSRKIWDLARTLPVSFLIDDSNGKLILRDVAKKELPDEWVKRKKKGFPVPLKDWLREENTINTLEKCSLAPMPLNSLSQIKS